MDSSRTLRHPSARTRRAALIRRACIDAGIALGLATAAATGVIGSLTFGPAPVVAATAPPQVEVQSFVAPGESAHASLVASSYSASTHAEIVAAQVEALRAMVAAGIPFSTDDLPEVEGVMTASLGWVQPTIGWISDTFGTRGGAHHGIDIAATEGTPVVSATPGIVVLSEEAHQGYGVAVMIEHADGVRTLYGHLVSGSRTVEVGDWVEPGAPIGSVGNTGRSFGPHLHFEVRVDGAPVDPLPFLP